MFIGGEWLDATDGAEMTAWSPATGEDLGPVANGGREDARLAIAAARDAFEAWCMESAFARARALHRVADRCEAARDELAYACTLDQGKPLTEAYDEVDELVAMWRAGAEEGIRLEGSIPPGATTLRRVLVLRRALGVVAVVTPWNWPYTMAAELLAPALATGNTVAWTPAPSTAFCSGVLARCVAEADLPAGVFNFVPGPGPVVGDELVGHPDVAAVGFVGSTATGLQIARRAAGKVQLLEMGGNGPLVVMDDADLDAAAHGAVTGCFLCAGQSCTAGERLLVHRDVRQAFVEHLVERVAAEVRLGDPFASDTTMGPLNNNGVADKMDAHVTDAISRGAAVLTGGARTPGFPTELYWPATVIDGVPRAALAAAEETFGPIAPIIEITSLNDAIELTNTSAYGLLAAIYTRDLSAALHYADRVRTGQVNINETTNYWESHLPFGGRAGTGSGIGRVGGRHAATALTDLQTIVIHS